MMSTKGSPPAAQPPAQLAKAALRRLAEQRLEPTPENYRKAYEAESGVPSDKAHDKPADDHPAAHGDKAAAAADEGERWSTLISRILRGAERGGRQWTAARKKDSLNRVLESSKSSAHRLHQRLTQLVTSWDTDTLDNAPLDDDEAQATEEAAPHDAARQDGIQNASASTLAPAPAWHDPSMPTLAPHAVQAHPSASRELLDSWKNLALHAMGELNVTAQAALPVPQPQAVEASDALNRAVDTGGDTALPASQHARVQTEITQACEQARRIIEHRHRLIDQLTALCQSLTDSLVDLSEDDSWVQGQCQLMRHQLEDGLQGRGVRHVQQILADTREHQRTLKQEREAARQSLKHLIHQMLQEIAELGSTTGRFHESLGRYAETIGAADSLESLTGVVREMVEESRAVQAVVSQTQTRLQDEHTRATELTERVRLLEDEIRRLSDEVSTDPLTQIANRRGMMRAFEAEQAKMQREGTQLAIGLLDVDNFKKLNDTLGHQTGDEALKFLARRVGQCLRPADVVARYGGEEFVVLLPDTALEEAQHILTRLQRTLSAEFFTHEDKKVFITFSAGVTLYRFGEGIETALDRADLALYEAKRNGKNRTCMA